MRELTSKLLIESARDLRAEVVKRRTIIAGLEEENQRDEAEIAIVIDLLRARGFKVKMGEREPEIHSGADETVAAPKKAKAPVAKKKKTARR